MADPTPQDCATRWTVYESRNIAEDITIERVSLLSNPPRFYVMQTGYAFGRDGQWHYLPLPSSRTEQLKKLISHDTFESAWNLGMKLRGIAMEGSDE